MSINSEKTAQRVFNRYHSATRRGLFTDPNMRRVLFKSFERRFPDLKQTNRNAAILEVGCGEGGFLTYLKGMGFSNLHAFDISPENIELCHSLGLGFVSLGNLSELSNSEPQELFDIIFAMDVIEHVPKDHAAAALEALRMRLKAGGTLVLQTPNMSHLLASHYRYYDLTHEFGVNEKSMTDLLLVAGFDPQHVHVVNCLEATTTMGRARELYTRLLHSIVFLIDGSNRPRVWTKNLIARAVNR